MLTFSLNSGSNGNAIYVEADGARLLFDAGISARQAEQRMNQHGRTMADVDAVIVSHDHVDHVRCVGIYQRRFKMPVYMSRGTHLAAAPVIGPLDHLRLFDAGSALTFGAVRVHTIKTPHDAADGVAFVVEYNGKRLGILTDLGHPFRGLSDVVDSLDAAYLEANYDPELLDIGRYPIHVKRRIAGPGGHLSNDESAGLVPKRNRRLKWLAVAHLSQDNNRPELAVHTHRRRVGQSFPVFHAPRYEASPVFEVG